MGKVKTVLAGREPPNMIMAATVIVIVVNKANYSLTILCDAVWKLMMTPLRDGDLAGFRTIIRECYRPFVETYAARIINRESYLN